jgi:hypothetical protein
MAEHACCVKARFSSNLAPLETELGGLLGVSNILLWDL